MWAWLELRCIFTFVHHIYKKKHHWGTSQDRSVWNTERTTSWNSMGWKILFCLKVGWSWSHRVYIFYCLFFYSILSLSIKKNIRIDPIVSVEPLQKEIEHRKVNFFWGNCLVSWLPTCYYWMRPFRIKGKKPWHDGISYIPLQLVFRHVDLDGTVFISEKKKKNDEHLWFLPICCTSVSFCSGSSKFSS